MFSVMLLLRASPIAFILEVIGLVVQQVCEAHAEQKTGIRR